MATTKYIMKTVYLLPADLKWLKKKAKQLSKDWGRYVSESNIIRFMIDAHK